MIAKKTLFLNADKSKAVPEGHEDARFLLVREGQEISDADAEKYGVSGKKKAHDEVVDPPIHEPDPSKRKHK